MGRHSRLGQIWRSVGDGRHRKLRLGRAWDREPVLFWNSFPQHSTGVGHDMHITGYVSIGDFFKRLPQPPDFVDEFVDCHFLRRLHPTLL
jgi:hypothetical protein